jgi:hypothetical protein
MALPDLTGNKIKDTYQRVVQTGDGKTFYNGTGSQVSIVTNPYTGSLAISGSIVLNGPINIGLNNLNDVTITSVQPYDLLVRNLANNDWVNTANPGGDYTWAGNNTFDQQTVHNTGILTKGNIEVDAHLVHNLGGEISPGRDYWFATASIGKIRTFQNSIEFCDESTKATSAVLSVEGPNFIIKNNAGAKTAISGANANFTNVVQAGSFIGPLTGTASWATNAVTASNARTASFVTTAQTASYVLNAISSSFAATASFVRTAQTASYVLNAVSSSFATTASYALNGGVTQIIAGTNVTISPVGGTGAVTINSSGTGGSTDTGSLLRTASVNLNTITFTKGDGSTFPITVDTGSGGGVTQLLAGANISLSPTSGVGQVTITSTGGGGGGFNTATGSYGSFYDTTTQTNPVANVPRSMSFNSTDISNGVSISGSTNPFNTYIKVANAGVYDIQFSAQLDKTDFGSDSIIIWIRKNGIDLAETATDATLQGNNAKAVAAWNWFVNAAAGDYFQLMWFSPDTDVRLYSQTATANHPGIPSVILTANRVDQFLSNTGSFTGSFTGSLFGTASWANNALTASFLPVGTYNITSSWATNALTASNLAPAIANNTDNRVLTATGNGSINGEANLTFDGSLLDIIGDIQFNENRIRTSSTTVGQPGKGADLAYDWGNFTTTPTAGRIVYFASGSGGFGWRDALASATGSSIGPLGVATNAASQDEIMLRGTVRVSGSLSGLAAGQVVYLNNAVSGGVTGTAPSTTGHVVRIIGYVISPTDNTMYFNPDFSYITRT